MKMKKSLPTLRQKTEAELSNMICWHMSDDCLIDLFRWANIMPHAVGETIAKAIKRHKGADWVEKVNSFTEKKPKNSENNS